MSNIHTEDLSQRSFCPLTQQEISVLFELRLGRMRYHFTYEPPQPNSPSENVLHQDRSHKRCSVQRLGTLQCSNWEYGGTPWSHQVSRILLRTHKTDEITSSNFPFRGKEGPKHRNHETRWWTLTRERMTGNESRPPSSLQCNERNNVRSGGISLLPESSLLCYASKIISQFKLEWNDLRGVG